MLTHAHRSDRVAGGARAVLVAAVLAWSAGCSFDPTFPEGVISCRSEKDCPPGYGCGRGALCYRLDNLDAGLPVLGDGSGGAGGRGGGGGGGAVDGGMAGGSGGNIGSASGGSGGESPGTGGSGGASASGGAGGSVVGSGGAIVDSGGADVPAADAGGDVHDTGTVDTNPICPSGCTLGDTRCASGGVSTCVMVGSCPDWSTPAVCQGRKTCQGSAPRAACACAAPPTGCEAGAGQVCAGQTLRTCAADGDGCTYEKMTESCPTARPCTGSHPTAACTCPAPPAVCAGGQGTACESTQTVVTCGHDAAGCLAVTQRTSCPAGKPCTGNAPSASCSCAGAPSECRGVAGVFCRDATHFGSCALDGNGCLQIASESTCAAGLICEGTAPAAACVCPAAPADCAGGDGHVCRGTGQVVTCGRDANGCSVITNVADCPSGKPCAGSSPTAACTCAPPPSECAAGVGAVCGGSGAGQVITCGPDPSNGCVVITGRADCTGSKTCQGSFPSAACGCPAAPGDCSAAGKVCRTGNVLATCGLDSSGCLATTDSATCASGLTCGGSFPNASCMCPAAPSECSNGAGSYCASTTSRVTCTRDANSCYHASSATCTSGQYCGGAFPGATCQAPQVLGFQTDLGGLSKHTANTLLGMAITVGANVTLRHFGIVSRTAGQVTMGLYKDVGGAPTTLVASVVGQNLVVGDNQYPVIAQPTLTSGQYWVMAVFSADVNIAHDSGASTATRFVAQTFSNPLPSTLGVTNPYQGSNMNYYVLVLPQ